jgi:hypothetical protein
MSDYEGMWGEVNWHIISAHYPYNDMTGQWS